MFSQKIAAFKAAQIKEEDRQPNTYIPSGNDGECLGYTNRQTSIIGLQQWQTEAAYQRYSRSAQTYVKDLVRLKDAADRSDCFYHAREEMAGNMMEGWMDAFETLERFLDAERDTQDPPQVMLDLLRASINSVDWPQLAERFLDAEIEDYYGSDQVRQRKLESQYSGS